MSNANDRLNKYRNELINKTVYWLTCIDVVYEDSVYTAKCQCKCGNIKLVPASRFAKQQCSKSCGCYKTSEEFSEKQRKYILDRPELVIAFCVAPEEFLSFCSKNNVLDRK